MSVYQKKIYYVTQTQYNTLYNNGAKDGTITVSGVTYTWDNNATYFIKETAPAWTVISSGDTQIDLAKNGAAVGSPITVPYSSFAGSLGNGSVGTSAGGAASAPVYFDAGVPKAITSMPYSLLTGAPSIPVIPSNNVIGSGTSGYLTKWSDTNTITNGPALGTDTTTYLRNDGTWAIPAGTYSLPTASASTLGGITTNYTATSTAGTVYNAPVAMSGTNAYVAMTKTAITTALNSSTLPTQTGSASYAISTSVSSSSTDAQIPTAKSVYTAMSAAIGLQLTATTAGTNYYFLLANASTGGSTSAAYVTSPLLYNNGTATFSGNFYASGTGFSLVANNGAILKTDSYIASNTSGSGAIYTNEQSNDYTAYGANAIVFDDSDGADHLLSFPKEDGTLLTTASTASSTTRGGVKIYSSGSTLYINT